MPPLTLIPGSATECMGWLASTSGGNLGKTQLTKLPATDIFIASIYTSIVVPRNDKICLSLDKIRQVEHYHWRKTRMQVGKLNYFGFELWQGAPNGLPLSSYSPTFSSNGKNRISESKSFTFFRSPLFNPSMSLGLVASVDHKTSAYRTTYKPII